MSKGNFKKALANSFTILKVSVSNFGSNQPAQLAGTTSYSAMFSMAPILFIAKNGQIDHLTPD